MSAVDHRASLGAGVWGEAHALLATPPGKVDFGRQTRARSNSPGRPRLTCRAVYRAVVRQSKACGGPDADYAVSTRARLRGGGAQVVMCPAARRARTTDLWPKAHATMRLLSLPRRTSQLQVCLLTSRRARRPTGPHMCPTWQPRREGLAEASVMLGRQPTPRLPEHWDRTSTVAGLSVVCLGAVRSGVVIGGHLVFEQGNNENPEVGAPVPAPSPWGQDLPAQGAVLVAPRDRADDEPLIVRGGDNDGASYVRDRADGGGPRPVRDCADGGEPLPVRGGADEGEPRPVRDRADSGEPFLVRGGADEGESHPVRDRADDGEPLLARGGSDEGEPRVAGSGAEYGAPPPVHSSDESEPPAVGSGADAGDDSSDGSSHTAHRGKPQPDPPAARTRAPLARVPRPHFQRRRHPPPLPHPRLPPNPSLPPGRCTSAHRRTR